jgi:TIR domain
MDISTGVTVRADFLTAAVLTHEQLEAARQRNLAQEIGQRNSTPRPPQPPEHTPQQSNRRPEGEKPSRRSDQVFISYSHKDKVWLERLQVMLKPLVRKGEISLWDDTRITPGKNWQQEVKTALASAKVAILLVSKDFIASDFVVKNELPPLLHAAEREGLVILWLCLGHCLYKKTDIYRFQAVHDPSKPLSSLRGKAQWEKVLADLGQKVEEAIQSASSIS